MGGTGMAESGAQRAVRAAGNGVRVGITAAAGVGVVAGLASAAVAALLHQAKVTASMVESLALEAAVAEGVLRAEEAGMAAAHLPVPRADGSYRPDGSYLGERAGFPRPVTMAMLGDSTSVGYGCRTADELPGVQLARVTAAALGTPVRLLTAGLVGCGAADLARQIREVLPLGPDVVIIVIGANDIRDKVPPGLSARLLGEAVAVLRAEHIPVVVASCPDFGVIAPIPQPLRTVLHTWSQRLATLQERAVLAAGGRVVPVGRLVSPEFAGKPEFFASDHFHPSGAGYARAVAALAPITIEELRNRPEAAIHQVRRSDAS